MVVCGGVLGPEGRGDLPFVLRHLPREAVRVCPIVPNTLHFAVPTPTGPSSPCHQVNVPSPTERVGDRPVEWALNTLSGDSDGLLGGFPFSYRGQRKRWWTPSGGRDPLQVRRNRDGNLVDVHVFDGGHLYCASGTPRSTLCVWFSLIDERVRDGELPLVQTAQLHLDPMP